MYEETRLSTKALRTQREEPNRSLFYKCVKACFSGKNSATNGKRTDEYRTRNVEGRRRKSPRKAASRHEKSGSTDFDLASLPSRIPLEFSRFSWLSDPSARALLPSTFLVRSSAVPAVSSGVIWLTASPRQGLRVLMFDGKSIEEHGGLCWNSRQLAQPAGLAVKRISKVVLSNYFSFFRSSLKTLRNFSTLGRMTPAQ